MPLALDDGPAVAGATQQMQQGGLDLQTSNTLFWKQVPLLIRQPDREDQNDELTFRILTGTLRSNHNMRVLRIHISSETDLFFLHTLEVSEEDFQSLKNEQGILVDFASFPVKIITLLDKCTSVQPVDAPRFQAVLTVRGMESMFRIVETNDFKQLPHITLTFRPGNDAAIKQFLAFRLLEVKGDAEDLTKQLQNSQNQHSSTSCDLAQVKQQLAALQEQYDKHIREVQAESKTQRAAAHEERARERSELKDAHDKELAELTRKHQDTVSQLSARLNEVDAENRKLRDNKYQLDTKVSELSHRLGSAEGTNRSLEEEVARLRALSSTLSSERAERDVTLNDIRARLLSAEEKSAAQSEVIESQRSRVRDLESGVKSSEARCTELREALAAEVARVKELQQEVVKGNTAIEKLASDLRLSKEKVKRKQSILVRQEEEINAREVQLGQAAKEAQAAAQHADALKEEISKLRQENNDLRGKIEDSKQQLQMNEQMIRWLNQQVTDAQLGSATSGALPGSRYASYRPPALPPPSVAPPSSAAATPAILPPPSTQPSIGHATAVISATPSATTTSTVSKYTAASAYGSVTTTSKSYLQQPLHSPVRPSVTPGPVPSGPGAGAQGLYLTGGQQGGMGTRYSSGGGAPDMALGLSGSGKDYMTPGAVGVTGGAAGLSNTSSVPQPASRFFSNNR